MSELTDIMDQVRAYQRSELRAVLHAPFYPGGSCPLRDSVGNPYDWAYVCEPGFNLTGAVVDAGGRVLGSAMLLAADVAVTAARVVQGHDPVTLGIRFRHPRTLRGSGIKAARTARSGVTYSNPTSLELLVAQASSDIALLQLARRVSPAPSRWVGLGTAPDRERVAFLAQHPDERCRGVSSEAVCIGTFGDAVLYSYYSPSDEYVTAVQWSAVAENGSVLVAWLDYQPGARSEVASANYQPAMDVGAPAVVPGAGIRPEVVGVVSGMLAVEGAGTYYRITRLDAWAGWIADTVREWSGIAPGEVPPGEAPPIVPGVPPAPPRRRASRGGGSLLPGAVLLGLGGLGISALR